MFFHDRENGREATPSGSSLPCKIIPRIGDGPGAIRFGFVGKPRQAEFVLRKITPRIGDGPGAILFGCVGKPRREAATADHFGKNEWRSGESGGFAAFFAWKNGGSGSSFRRLSRIGHRRGESVGKPRRLTLSGGVMLGHRRGESVGKPRHIGSQGSEPGCIVRANP